MFTFRHKTLIFLSGAIWFLVGAYLLPLGLSFVLESTNQSHLPMMHFLEGYTGGAEGAAILIVVVGLMAGFFKGRYILSKSVNRLVDRIISYEEPTAISKIYTFPYFLLLVSMIFIGISIKYFGVPKDIRGLIDIAVGAALINGAMLYFRAAQKR